MYFKLFLFSPLLLRFINLDFDSPNIVKNNCDFIQVIFNSPKTNHILGLDKANEIIPWIRVIDLSGKFGECSGFYKKNDTLVVPYFVLSKIPPNINSGLYRDIIIFSVKKIDKSKRLVSVYECRYATDYDNRNMCFSLDLLIGEKGTGYLELISEKIHESDDYGPLPVNYNKIE